MLRLRRALTRHGSITPFPEPASSTIATEARCSDVSRRFFAKLAILDVTKGTVIEWKGKPAVVTSMIHTKGLARQLGKVELQLRDLRSGSKISTGVIAAPLSRSSKACAISANLYSLIKRSYGSRPA